MANNNNKFINPYNFVSLEKGPKRVELIGDKPKNSNSEDKFRGYIEYELTSKSKIFIPNTNVSVSTNEHKSYDFFTYDVKDNKPGVPVIPGSEIRGVIRSIYETLTNSCLSILDSEYRPIRRSMIRFNHGLIKYNNGKYKLYKAKSYSVNKAYCVKKMFKNGQKLKFKVKKQFFAEIVEDGKNCNIGYLIKWGMGGTKEHFHIYKAEESLTNIDDNQIETIYSIIDSYIDLSEDNNNIREYKAYKNKLEAFVNKNKMSNNKCEDYFPVNYLFDDGDKNLIYLAPAIYTREYSYNTVGDCCGAYKPCDGKNVCPACKLFGTINNEISLSSKVRFTDLYLSKEDSKDYYCNKIRLDILGSPKPACAEYYLKKPDNADFFNYDYYIKNKHEIRHTGEIRGRKFYWHGTPEEKDSSDENSKLNVTIRPLKENVKFKGKVYFENINKDELDKLICILNQEVNNIGFKIGMAKPLGYGSFSTKVIDVITVNYDLNTLGKILLNKYQYDQKSQMTKFFGDNDTTKKLSIICSLNNKKECSYPNIDDNIFRWFAKNKQNNGNKSVRYKFTLPDITEE